MKAGKELGFSGNASKGSYKRRLQDVSVAPTKSEYTLVRDGLSSTNHVPYMVLRQSIAEADVLRSNVVVV